MCAKAGDIPDFVAPDVEPAPAMSDRVYQRLDVNPRQFGAQVGAAEAELAPQFTHVGQVFGQMAADNAANQWQDQVNKILHGDPNKTVIGPDGQPTPDTGFYGLTGDAALRARPQVEQQLDQLLQSARNGLETGQQQLEFDQNTRRYRFFLGSEIATHADQQARVWGTNVNKASADLALDHVAQHAGDDDEFEHGVADLTRARVRQAQLAGGGDALVNEAVAGARRDATEARIKALEPTDPARALQLLNDNRGLLAASRGYDALSSRLQSAADRTAGIALGRSLYQGTPQGGAPVAASGGGLATGGAVATRIADEADRQGVSTDLALRTAHIESAMGERLGRRGNIFQLGNNEWQEAGGGDMRDPATQVRNGVAWLGRVQQQMTTALGRPPAPEEIYLGHQQGVAGAVALITHPDTPAGLLVPPQNIRNNAGDPGAPASEFIGHWQRAYDRAGAGSPQAAAAPVGATPELTLAFGDSIAAQQIRHGVAGTEAPFGSAGLGPAGATARIGDTPAQVNARIAAMPPDQVKGKSVFLSPGTSNNPDQVDLVGGQVASMLRNGAAAVVVPGVGPGVKNADQVNARLKDLVEQNGGVFFQPQVRWQQDGIHPAEVDKVRQQAQQALAQRQPPDQLQGQAGAPAAAAPAPGAAFAASTPDIDDKVAQVQQLWDRGQLSDGAARAAIGEINRMHREWLVQTRGERTALRQSIGGGIALLASGRDYAYDPAQIRRLLPGADADKALALLDDAKTQGDAMRSVSGSTPEQLAATRARLQAGLDTNLNPADFARRQRDAAAFERAAEQRLGEFETQATQAAIQELHGTPVPPAAIEGRLNAEQLKEFAQGSPQHGTLLATLGDYPSIVDQQRRQRLLDHFDAAAAQHYKALASDPASYVASWNPDIQRAAEAAAQAHDPAEASRTFGQYAAAAIGMQEHLGLRPEQQHVLGAPQAQLIAQELTADPENAPARMRGMAARFGDYWPKVWQDLATIGHLPGGWQLVGQLADYDPVNSGLLARELAQQAKSDRGGALAARPGAGAKSIDGQLAEALDGDPRIVQFERSLANGFVGEAARNDIVGAVHALAKARFLYAGEDPATAAAKAVDAAVGHYQFDPASGARAPAAIFDRISAAAHETVGALGPNDVTIPPGFAGGAQPTPQDYVAALKAAPLWVNAPKGDAWWLVDRGGRFVLDINGNHVAVPFGAASLPPQRAATPGFPPDFLPY